MLTWNAAKSLIITMSFKFTCFSFSLTLEQSPVDKPSTTQIPMDINGDVSDLSRSQKSTISAYYLNRLTGKCWISITDLSKACVHNDKSSNTYFLQVSNYKYVWPILYIPEYSNYNFMYYDVKEVYGLGKYKYGLLRIPKKISGMFEYGVASDDGENFVLKARYVRQEFEDFLTKDYKDFYVGSTETNWHTFDKKIHLRIYQKDNIPDKYMISLKSLNKLTSDNAYFYKIKDDFWGIRSRFINVIAKEFEDPENSYKTPVLIVKCAYNSKKYLYNSKKYKTFVMFKD